MKDRYSAKIADHAADYGRASMSPDKEKLGKVRIFDTTGRDGMQMPNAFETERTGKTVMQNKYGIAMRLARWGIPIIEVGNAVSSTEEEEVIRRVGQEVKELGLGTEIVSLARMVRGDIDAARRSKADTLHIFTSGSVPHVWVKFGKTPGELIPNIVEMTKYGKSVGFKRIIVSLEDSVRADPDHLVEVARRIRDIGVDGAGGVDIRMNIPDTVGVADPAYMFALIRYIKAQCGDMPLQVHCHNDMGRAVDNTLAAIYAGASEFHATMHGMGERTGNASLEQILVNLRVRHGIELIDTTNIASVSRFIQERSGVKPAVGAPVVGRNSFNHEAGVHGDAVRKCQVSGFSARGGPDAGSVYAAYDPTLVGAKETIGVGPLCGKANVKAHLEDFGVQVPDGKVAGIVTSVKEWTSERRISDADFILMAYREVNDKICERISYVKSTASSTSDGGEANVSLWFEGSTHEATAAGNGPVDAAVKAIRTALGTSNIEISSYESESMGSGSDAKARVTITVRKNGDSIESSVVGPDTVRTAIDAFVKGYNALCALEELRAAQPETA